MIDAEMRGKIRPDVAVSRQEDVLTSNVFGLMQIVPKHLINILAKAKHIKDDHRLGGVIASSWVIPDSFKLWESFKKAKQNEGLRDEPDVYFELENKMKIIVEVKYRSGESNESQLANYAEHCTHLVYLTFFNDHQREAKEKYVEHEKVYLLSWRDFYHALRDEIDKADSLVSSALLRHIEKYLSYKIGSIWDGWSGDFTAVASSGSFYDNGFFNYTGNQQFNNLGGFYNGTRA